MPPSTGASARRRVLVSGYNKRHARGQVTRRYMEPLRGANASRFRAFVLIAATKKPDREDPAKFDWKCLLRLNLQRGTLMSANGRRTRSGDDRYMCSPCPKNKQEFFTATHAKLPQARRCFEDAIHYAGEGFPVSARVSRWIEQTAPEMDAASKAIFLPEGKPAPILRNIRLAETLRAIAAHGRAGFYEGDMARELAAARRLLHRRRPRRAERALGRAAARHLSRRDASTRRRRRRRASPCSRC